MELAFNTGLLGDFDVIERRPKIEDKPVIVKFIATIGGIIGAIIAFFLILSMFGSCLGCSTCIACLNSCGCNCGTTCYEMGCKRCNSSSSSSGCGSRTTYNTTYKTVTAINAEGGVDKFTTATHTSKSGCKKAQTWTETSKVLSKDTTYFELIGVYYDSAYTKEVPDIYKADANKTYYSKWVEKGEGQVFVLQFSNDAGLNIPNIEVRVGEKIPLPQIVTQVPGYTFKGVYDQNGTQVIDSYGYFNTSYDTFHLYNYSYDTLNQVKLEARYEPIEYTISIYAVVSSTGESTYIGHSLAPYNSKLSEVYDSIKQEFSSEEYVLKGLSLAENGTTMSNAMLESTRISADIDVYLILSPYLTITFVVKDGTSYTQKLIAERAEAIPTLLDEYKPSGFSFSGWYDNDSYSGEAYNVVSQLIDRHVDTLYARLQGNQYNITYYQEGISYALGHSSYYSSNQVFELFDESKIDVPQGYIFLGWREAGKEEIVHTIEPFDYGHKDYYLALEAKKYNIYLDPSYGNLDTNSRRVTLSYDEKDIVLPVPEVTTTGDMFYGYKFNDYFITDANGKLLAPFNESLLHITFSQLETYDVSTENRIRLEANIDLATYTVELMVGNVKIKTFENVQYGAKVSYSEEITVEKGKRFVGWNKDKNSLVGYAIESFPITSDTVLYAIIQAVLVDVTFKNGDSSLNILMPSKKGVLYGTSSNDTTFNLPNYSSEPAYEFDGYYYNDVKVVDKNGKLVNPSFIEDYYGLDYDTFVQGLEFTSKSVLRVFKVTYYNNSVVYAENTGNYQFYPTKPAIDPTPQVGYIFTGWVDENGQSFDFDTQIVEDINLYSSYAPNTYSAKFLVDPTFVEQGLVTIINSTRELEYDSQFEFEVPIYTGVQYQFAGWYAASTLVTDAEGHGVDSYKFNTNLPGHSSISQFEDGNVTFYAHYILKTFNMTFYTDYGTVYDEQQVFYGQTVDGSSYPVKDGYYFVGWYELEHQDQLFDFSVPITENHTLYPLYSNKIKITLYDTDGMTKLTELEIDYGSVLSVNYNYDDVKFTGWVLREDTSVKVLTKDNEVLNTYEAQAYGYDLNHLNKNIELVAKIG